MSTDIAVLPTESLALRHELSVEEVVARVNKVHEVMRRAMQDGHHYGVIPGTPKPTLLKPGAELLCVMFRLDPQYTVTSERTGPHLTVASTCTLFHVPTEQRVGSGMGSCSTREAKYAYRTESQKCPNCGQATIIKGKAEYGGGFLCFKKKGGCGEKFKDDDTAITGQTTGRVANEDLADAENTVLKMANKRSLVAAVLNVTAASDIFTQDLEDQPHEAPAPRPAQETGEILSSPGAAAESAAQESERLFLQEDELRHAIIERITALAVEKKIPPEARRKLSQSVLAGAALETADVAALQDLETAVKKWKPEQ